MENTTPLSSVSRGRRMFPEGKGNLRTQFGRRFSDLLQSFHAELGARAEQASVDQQLRRLASLCIAAEAAEARATQTDEPVDALIAARLSSEVRAAMKALGLAPTPARRADGGDEDDAELDDILREAGLASLDDEPAPKRKKPIARHLVLDDEDEDD